MAGKLWRVHYVTAPFVPHVYCQIFVAPGPDRTFAGVGTLTMRKDEFVAFREAFKAEYIAHGEGED